MREGVSPHRGRQIAQYKVKKSTAKLGTDRPSAQGALTGGLDACVHVGELAVFVCVAEW